MFTSTLSFSWSALISAISTGEVRERTLLHPHRLADLVLQPRLRPLRGLVALDLHLEERLHITAGQRRRLRALADEPSHAGRVADDVPGVVVHVAPHEQVAGEDLLLDDDLAAVLELDDVLHRDDDLEDLVLGVHRLGAGLEVLLDLLLVARLRVHDVPGAGSVVRALRSGSILVVLVLVLAGFRVEQLVVDEHVAWDRRRAREPRARGRW